MSPRLIVDARGHRRPVPTLRLRRALDVARAGDLVQLIADDPMARIDTPHFVREAGHELIEMTEDAGKLVFLVRKAAAAGPSD